MHSYTVKVADAAGNTKNGTGSQSLALDTSAPATPATPTSYADNVGSTQSATSTATTTDDTTPGLNIGTGLTDTPSLYVDGTKVAATYNATAGTLTPDTPLSLGQHSLSYTLTDAAGNTSLASGTLTLTMTPKQPTVTTSTLGLLSTVTAGTGGFVIDGQSAAELTGWGGLATGDVNGDGIADLIISAPYSDPATGTDAGCTYVVFGKTGTTAVNLSSIAAGSGGFVINGLSVSELDGFGWNGYIGQGVSVGDINGDGLADIIIGAGHSDPATGNDAGRTYVVFGKTGTTAVNLSAVVAGTGSFVINGVTNSDLSGFSVSSAGDVNGDGLGDLIVSAPYNDLVTGTDAGCSYVVFGKTDTTAINLSAVAAGTGGFAINGVSTSEYSGWSVSSAGDVNGDGLADLIVGTMYSNGNIGRSYVVFGKTGSTAINLSAVAAGTGGFAINGSADVFNGWNVASAGDVNGDGLADLIVSAPYGDPTSSTADAGRTYVVFGKTDTAAINLSAVAAGSGGFVINGVSAAEYSGWHVSSAGDMNGDGLADILLGTWASDPNGIGDAGRVYVVYGQTGTTAIDLSAIAAGSLKGFAINGLTTSVWTGWTTSSGDLNGDGLSDLVISAPYSDPTSSTADSGRTYVVFGSATGSTGATWVDQMGTSGNDTLSDSGSAQTLVGDTGDDTFTATAASVLYGGSGNDTFVIGQAMITALQSTFGSGGNADRLASINGGGGADTIKLSGSGLNLDFTQISNTSAGSNTSSRVSSIEAVDLNGSNTVKITAHDVFDMSSAVTGTNHLLKVLGSSASTLDLADGSGTTGWTSAGTVTDAGITYNVWNASATHATVWAQQGVIVA